MGFCNISINETVGPVYSTLSHPEKYKMNEEVEDSFVNEKVSNMLLT